MDPLLRQHTARDRERTSHTECPDAEVLAAFIDGELTAHERRAVEAHAAGCQRCTDTLALSAAAADPALSATITHVVAVDRWRRAYWTVPVATAATLAALWVATSREAVAPTERRLGSGTSAVQSQPVAPQEHGMVTREPGGNAREAARQSQRNDTASPRLRDEPAPAPAASPVVGQEAALERASPGKTEMAKPAAAEARAEPRRSADAAAVAGPPARALSDAIGIASITIASPGKQTVWRTTGTTVERSSDGGTMWVVEFTAPGVLTAGAALSSDIAWIGGVQGLVLRRSASGWTVVNPPAAETVTAIRATSGDTATVILASGRTFRTIDAGQSWR